ncbi:DUF1931 family protein [Nocardioides aquiterrae]|uniref:DUF1931 family protein n=2 Tax=Nocardioides aquiterrae TaxID=203799 RepID=A0ABP4F2N4_9ACTN
MSVMGVPKFERFFRLAAGLDVDKEDLKRYSDFVGEKLYDLLVVAQANAQANGRDVIQPSDLPVTKGLQERIHEFRRLDEEVDLQPILVQLATWPPLDVTVSEETESRLPAVVGGLSVALARTFRILDPDLKNPQTTQWDRSSDLMSLLL